MKKEVSGIKEVLGYLGVFLIFIGILTAVPMLFMFYPGEDACSENFLIPVFVDIVVGLILYFLFFFHKRKMPLVGHQDSLLLVLIWVTAIISNAAPMFIANMRGQMQMNFGESVFEVTSAFSTTGLNVFKDFLDSPNPFCPHVYTFARAWMQFLGGMGFVLILASLLGGRTSMTLYQSEGHNDRIFANLSKTAKIIFGIYSTYTILGTFALWFSGMPLFDALTTSMCALSGGGLSCRSTNIAFYRDYEGIIVNYHYVGDQIVYETGNVATFPVCFVAIEIVMMVLVLLSAISFVLHTFLLSGKWKKFFRDDEIIFLALSILIFFGLGYLGAYLSMSQSHQMADFKGSAMDVLFYMVGSATNSGFSTTSLARFNQLGRPVFALSLILMFIGGGVGSTAGGVKGFRVIVQLKEIYYLLRYRFISPHQFVPKTIYRYGKVRELDLKTERESFQYLLFFLGMVVASTVALLFLPDGSRANNASVNFPIALYNVVSASSNTGYGLSDFLAYRAEFGALSFYYQFYLWVLTFDMLLGRLEILPIIYAISAIPEEVMRKRQEALSARVESVPMDR